MAAPKLGMIVASTEFGQIGHKQGLPWQLKGDLKNFKQLTLGQVVIMGRKTLESLPGRQPLPDRINIILSDKPHLSTQLDIAGPAWENTYVVDSIEKAIDRANRFGTEWIYFIGGAKIYEEAIELVERVCLTLVHQEGRYDTRIKNFSLPTHEWRVHQQSPTVFMEPNEDGIILPSHTFFDYRRISQDTEQSPTADERGLSFLNHGHSYE